MPSTTALAGGFFYQNKKKPGDLTILCTLHFAKALKRRRGIILYLPHLNL